jgi:hypothetical protein
LQQFGPDLCPFVLRARRVRQFWTLTDSPFNLITCDKTPLSKQTKG